VRPHKQRGAKQGQPGTQNDDEAQAQARGFRESARDKQPR